MLSRRLLRVKVVKALFGHLKSDSTNMIASEKTLLASIDKTYDLYFQLMELIVEVRRHAESRLETARRKKLPTYEDLNPNTKFVENKAIALLASSQTVNDYLVAQTQLGALSRTHQIALYPAAGVRTTIVVTCKIRRGPSRRTSSSSRSFYRQQLEGLRGAGSRFGRAVDPVERRSGFRAMVVRTLSNLRASSTDVKVLPKFKSDDDLAFVKTLFEKVLVNYDQTQRYIERFTSNWDIERIAFMDYLILATAVAELTSCPEIPVKVTLDEYIEISKILLGAGQQRLHQRRARQTGRRADRGGKSKRGGASFSHAEVAECFWGWLRGRRRGARAALRLRLAAGHRNFRAPLSQFRPNRCIRTCRIPCVSDVSTAAKRRGSKRVSAIGAGSRS